MSQLFAFYGKLCATHPWEVIVAVITLTVCFLSLDRPAAAPKKPPVCRGCFEGEQQFQAADMVLMTVIRCLAILYSYHQFRRLRKTGSKYILGIAGLFVVFSSFVFTSTLLNFLHVDPVDLKDALFFFLLLIDLSKAAVLAQYALTASNTEEISGQIARGVSALGPALTLDTVVETLVIGVGTLSGVRRLETLSYFACVSVIVNYVIFMTIYPACLSLMLELARVHDYYGENDSRVREKLLENEKANPAVQRVKLIMSIGLLAVHVQSRWTPSDTSPINNMKVVNNRSDGSSIYGMVMKQFVIGADHIVILVLVLTLMVKFIFFESKEHPKGHLEPEIKQTGTASINAESQTDRRLTDDAVEEFDDGPNDRDADVPRSLQTCLEIFRGDGGGARGLSDEEIMMLVDTKHVPAYNLEGAVGNPERGVKIRRKIVGRQTGKGSAFLDVPYRHYDYGKVMGACCENVVGYVPVPLGVAGPLLLDDKFYYVPMATTEGCLVASANRGCRALEKCGVKSRIVADGMTRGPVVRFQSITRACEVIYWLKRPENFAEVKERFDSTSRFARLTKVTTHVAGRCLFVRFAAETGDAMGMNMISKGTERALRFIKSRFDDMEILSLSGNVCTDKKPSAINWVEGRGKSVVCEAVVPASAVHAILKTSARALVDLNVAKNMIGSAVSGSVGGFNAHAANVVTAIYVATGQDVAQNVGSSNCITLMERCGVDGEDLLISCTMPSVEIGTVGGGTVLPAQGACLEMLGVKGPHDETPGANAKQLARIVCGAVLAGELSLMAALATGNLVNSHLRLNRSSPIKDEEGS